MDIEEYLKKTKVNMDNIFETLKTELEKLGFYLLESDTNCKGKEYEYMSKLDEKTQRERFEIITDSYTPCIIMTEGFEVMNSLIEVASHKNFPVFKYPDKTYQLIVDLVSYLSEMLAPVDNLYGVMMSIYGRGIMIMGKSGIGKSELALDLINRGHMLVADDRVDVARVHTQLLCQAPELLKRKLEIYDEN